MSWFGGVKSKGGNDGGGEQGADDGGKLWEGRESCGHGGVMDLKVVWIRGGCGHVEVMGPCDWLFLKVIRVFGDNGGGEVPQVNIVEMRFE